MLRTRPGEFRRSRKLGDEGDIKRRSTEPQVLSFGHGTLLPSPSFPRDESVGYGDCCLYDRCLTLINEQTRSPGDSGLERSGSGKLADLDTSAVTPSAGRGRCCGLGAHHYAVDVPVRHPNASRSRLPVEPSTRRALAANLTDVGQANLIGGIAGVSQVAPSRNPVRSGKHNSRCRTDWEPAPGTTGRRTTDRRPASGTRIGPAEG